MQTTTVVDNSYDVALENFDTAADALELDQDMREMIKYPERVLTVTVPVRMDDGQFAASKAIGCSTARCAVPPRAGFAIHPRSRWMK